MAKSKKKELTREVGEKIQLNLAVEAGKTKDLGEGVIEAIVTTSGLDRHGEVIDTMGIDTDNYMQNPVVLYGHDYGTLPIAKAISVSKEENQLKARFQFAIKEFPFAETVYKLIKGGYLNAVSIGGVVKEWSQDFSTILKMEMVEFSVVPVPANPEAIITQRSLEEATGKSVQQLEEEKVEFIRASIVDKVKTIEDNELIKTVKMLENLTATLKEVAQDQSSEEQDDKVVKHIKKVRLMDTAKAVSRESQRVIRLIKLKE